MRTVMAATIAVVLLCTGAVTTAAQSPRTTTEELLSGMVTEEVEPGVYRVLNDGVRDLSPGDFWNIATGHDGSVWAYDGEDGFFRLGDVAVHEWPDQRLPAVFRVDPDGTVWILDYDHSRVVIRSFDGSTWETHKRVKGGSKGFEGAGCVPRRAMEVAPDGTVWATWPDPKSDRKEQAAVVARLTADGWQRTGQPVHADWCIGLYSVDGSDVWAVTGRGGRDWLERYVDGMWLRRSLLASSRLDIGTDGTVWITTQWEPRIEDGEYVTDEIGQHVYTVDLARFDGSDWDQWDAPEVEDPERVGLHVAPDGSVWMNHSVYDHDAFVRGGVTRFDGETWQRYLTDHHIASMDIAADGSVWLRAVTSARLPAQRFEVVDTYVITPEAVAAAE